MSLTDAAEARVTAFLTGTSGATAPTLPLKLRLMSANGSDSTPGTQVVGGTYAAQEVDFSAGGNDAIVRFEGLANPTTVAGGELWDSNGTPFRWQWAALAGGSVSVTDGVLEFPIAAIAVAVD
jgi:hypothetical protein